MKSRLFALTTVAAVLAIPATASAGDTVLTLNGPVAKSLRGKGVRIFEQLPARGVGSKVELPVAGGTIAAKATIDHQGELRFKKGKRRLYFTSLAATVGSGKQKLTANYGKKKVTLFTIVNGRSTASINRGTSTAKLSGAALKLTPAARKLIRRKLRVSARKGTFGKIAVNAAIFAEPPVLARPATAVNLIASSVTVHVKESFANYISSGTGSGDGVSAANGAIPGPPASNGVVYGYTFPMRANGWYDPYSRTADVFGQGTVRFIWASRGINIQASNPEIEINGSASRGIFTFGDGKRAVMFNLAPVGPTASADGKTLTYNAMPGSVAAGTDSSIFGGFYTPGDEFGYTSATLTIP